jgi:hypothetical protein
VHGLNRVNRTKNLSTAVKKGLGRWIVPWLRAQLMNLRNTVSDAKPQKYVRALFQPPASTETIMFCGFQSEIYAKK